jgi:6-phosphofructokinase 1
MNITQLGEPRFPSPRNHPVNDEHIIQDPETPTAEQAFFEIAGPRARLFFDPKTTRAGIVTCDGLCPGLNNVIRSLFPGVAPRLRREGCARLPPRFE